MGPREGVTLKGLGLSATAKGDRAPIVLIIVAAACLLIYFGKAFAEKMTEDHREVKEAMSEVTYVLSLSPEQREKLRLDMPESLRRKARSRD